MSDCMVRIIPKNPYSHIPERKVQEAVKYIGTRILVEDISSAIHESPVFVDCGENLEEIKCPFCGEKLDVGWWGAGMDRAFKNSFMDLMIETPCCHKNSSLNDLDYDFSCGFACTQIDIRNPVTKPDRECLTAIEVLFGEPVRVISARY